VRPLINRETVLGESNLCLEVTSDKNLAISGRNFEFDKVFALKSEQKYLFDSTARNLVLGCFHGFNATLIAYGQTGSGKTHTMGTGSTMGLREEQIGIVPRVFEFIFGETEKRKHMGSFTVKCSFLELYNEEFHDLLDPKSFGHGSKGKEIAIREEKNGTISVSGIKEERVNSPEECLDILNKGIAYRSTSATLMNEGSSRSHAIFTVIIEQKIQSLLDDLGLEKEDDKVPENHEEFITAKFTFVDLAGSERLKRTGATG